MPEKGPFRVFIEEHATFPESTEERSAEIKQLFAKAQEEGVEDIDDSNARYRFGQIYHNVRYSLRKKAESGTVGGQSTESPQGSASKSAIRLFVEENADFTVDGATDRGAITEHLRELLDKAQESEDPEVAGANFQQISSAFYAARREGVAKLGGPSQAGDIESAEKAGMTLAGYQHSQDGGVPEDDSDDAESSGGDSPTQREDTRRPLMREHARATSQRLIADYDAELAERWETIRAQAGKIAELEVLIRELEAKMEEYQDEIAGLLPYKKTYLQIQELTHPDKPVETSGG